MATDFRFSAAFLPSDRIVEVADVPVVAKVVREGFQVPPVTFNPAAASFFIDNLPPILAKQAPRVVSQSVTAGTKVTAGTVVDLILAPSNLIPFDIFDGVHADLRGRNISSLLDGILQDAPTRQTLLRYDKAQDVPQLERAALTQQFSSADIGFNEEDPALTFESAFNSARAALAFR